MGSCSLAIIRRVRPWAPDVWRMSIETIDCEGPTSCSWPASCASVASVGHGSESCYPRGEKAQALCLHLDIPWSMDFAVVGPKAAECACCAGTYEHPTETVSHKVILDVYMLRTAVKDWNFGRGDNP